MEGTSGLEDLATISIDILCPEEVHSAVQVVLANNDEITEKQSESVAQKGQGRVGKITKCEFCELTFKWSQNLKRHISRKHKDLCPDSINKGKSSCLECETKFRRTKELVQHLETKHKMEFKIETMPFENLKDVVASKAFEIWKDDYEKKNKCTYNVYGKWQENEKGTRYKNYRCNRSGWYRCKVNNDEQRQRRMKEFGSNKIGNNCTSTIKLRQNTNGTLEAEFNMTHYSHEIEIQHASRKVKNFNIEQGTTDYVYPKRSKPKRPYKRRVTDAQKEEFEQLKNQVQEELLNIEALVKESTIKNSQNVQMLYNRLQTARTVYEETNVH